MPNKLTVDDVQERLSKKNQNIRIIKSSYVVGYLDAKFKCSDHGTYVTSVQIALQNKNAGCIGCKKADKGRIASKSKRLDVHQVQAKVDKVHGKNKYICLYYNTCITPATFKCVKHNNTFSVTALVVTKGGWGCSFCQKEIWTKAKRTREQHVQFLKERHGKKYVLVGDYRSHYEESTYECHLHGRYTTLPAYAITRQGGCQTCSFSSSYSVTAIDWLNSIAQKEKIKIQHARNIGEAALFGDRRKVDGYCKKSNTVYEFLGDLFHGNPNRFKPRSKPHPFDKSVTAQQMQKHDYGRFCELQDMGYRVVYIYEADYYAGRRPKVFTKARRAKGYIGLGAK